MHMYGYTSVFFCHLHKREQLTDYDFVSLEDKTLPNVVLLLKETVFQIEKE